MKWRGPQREIECFSMHLPQGLTFDPRGQGLAERWDHGPFKKVVWDFVFSKKAPSDSGCTEESQAGPDFRLLISGPECGTLPFEFPISCVQALFVLGRLRSFGGYANGNVGWIQVVDRGRAHECAPLHCYSLNTCVSSIYSCYWDSLARTFNTCTIPIGRHHHPNYNLYSTRAFCHRDRWIKRRWTRRNSFTNCPRWRPSTMPAGIQTSQVAQACHTLWSGYLWDCICWRSRIDRLTVSLILTI